MIKHRDFTELRFTNETDLDKQDKIIYRFKDNRTNLIFSRPIDDKSWIIQDGSVENGRIYASQVSFKQLAGLESLLNLYKGNLEKQL